MALKNVGASVRARLLWMAQERHDSFEGLLVRYVHERLLYRLGRSEQATRFALKGALLFPLWGPEVPRATRDLDLLWHGDSSPEALAEVFSALCLMDEPDGVAFDAHSVAAERIREHQDYVGARVGLRADVDEARVRVQVDLGFGDAVDVSQSRAPFGEVNMPPLIDMKKCSGCGTCDAHCPLDVIHFDSEKGKPEVKYPDECWHCGSCRLDCPEEAITIRFGPEMLCL